MATLLENVVALYFAVNGWGKPFRCEFTDEDLKACESPDVVGISTEDGCALCAAHLDDGGEGQRFAPGVLEALKNKRLAYYLELGEEPET